MCINSFLLKKWTDEMKEAGAVFEDQAYLTVEKEHVFGVDLIGHEFINITFHHTNLMKKEEILKALQHLFHFLEEKKIEAVVIFEYDGTMKEVIETITQKENFLYYPIGENAKKVTEMIHAFRQNGVYCSGPEFWIEMEKYPDYRVEFTIQAKAQALLFIDDNLVDIFATPNEVGCFFQRYQADKEKMNSVLNIMKRIAQKYDRTSYSVGDDTVFIFSEPYGVEIEKAAYNTNLGYYLECGFLEMDLYDEELDKLLLFFEEEMEKRMKKQRLKAVLEGRSYNMIPKLWNKLYGVEHSQLVFSRDIETSLTEIEFQTYIKENIDQLEGKEIEEKEYERYQKALRKKANIIRIIQFGELYIIKTHLKCYILKEKDLA